APATAPPGRWADTTGPHRAAQGAHSRIPAVASAHAARRPRVAPLPGWAPPPRQLPVATAPRPPAAHGSAGPADPAAGLTTVRDSAAPVHHCNDSAPAGRRDSRKGRDSSLPPAGNPPGTAAGPRR